MKLPANDLTPREFALMRHGDFRGGAKNWLILLKTDLTDEARTIHRALARAEASEARMYWKLAQEAQP